MCYHNILTLMLSSWQDDNRYSATRGAHLNLKHAEKARVLVNKIPGMFCPLTEFWVCETDHVRDWIKLFSLVYSYDIGTFVRKYSS